MSTASSTRPDPTPLRKREHTRQTPARTADPWGLHLAIGAREAGETRMRLRGGLTAQRPDRHDSPTDSRGQPQHLQQTTGCHKMKTRSGRGAETMQVTDRRGGRRHRSSQPFYGSSGSSERWGGGVDSCRSPSRSTPFAASLDAPGAGAREPSMFLQHFRCSSGQFLALARRARAHPFLRVDPEIALLRMGGKLTWLGTETLAALARFRIAPKC